MSIKILGLFFSLIFFGLALFSWGQNPPVSPAKIQISEKSWDFGFTPADVFISHTAKITNLGKDTLVIAKIKTGCGCTSAPVGKKVLGPNESTNLEIVLNTKGYKGLLEKSVTVYSTDAVEPAIDIFFSALIDSQNSLVEFAPSMIVFDSVPANQIVEKQVWLKNISNHPLTIKVIEKPKDFVSFEIPLTTIAPKEKGSIVFRLKKDSPLENFKTSLCLELSGKEQIRYSLPINGTVIKK